LKRKGNLKNITEMNPAETLKMIYFYSLKVDLKPFSFSLEAGAQ